jgi:hypothetical protein
MDQNERRKLETHRMVLTTLDRVYADPVRLAEAVGGAEDDADATARVAAAFGLEPTAAALVLDQQFRGLTRARRARITEDLHRFGGPPGPGDAD